MISPLSNRCSELIRYPSRMLGSTEKRAIDGVFERMAGGAELHKLDVITIGRSSVDLYGQQIGSRLEDIATFAKSVGGSPANMAIGTARLGLKSGLVTRVVLEQMRREGVALQGIRTDPQRLTALVLLAVEDEGVSPTIFYRTDCADMAL